ncbi:MAG: hypothetical protein ABL907_01055 [Hyphomicrobium sp.]
MLPMQVELCRSREAVLGHYMRSVAADLRMIELADLVSYLKTSQMASVGALVQASIELSFKPDTVSFGYSGDVRLDWCCPPQIAFDMEFHHDAVHVYFRLMMEAQHAGVEILCISFDKTSGSPEENTIKLAQALASACLSG